jgi:LysM repeat protein
MMTRTKPLPPFSALTVFALQLAFASAAVCTTAQAQNSPNNLSNNFPISAAQQNTANEVMQKGVPLSELSANAPDNYTVKHGDTLWSISKLFLTSPWRWPELWGMNRQEIQNPHRIYPGQRLELERKNGVASLRVAGSKAVTLAVDNASAEPATIKLSPRTRQESLAELALTTLRPSDIEPFLVDPLILGDDNFAQSPRIVAAQEGRVLITKGDRVYARGSNGQPLELAASGPNTWGIFRNTVALKDPGSGEVLGYEAVFLGKARLVRSEGQEAAINTEPSANANAVPTLTPATIDILSAKEEIRPGDRLALVPTTPNPLYTPHPPIGSGQGRIVSIYGAAVNAGQNQVVTINRGTWDAMETGTVLAILKNGAQVVDKSDQAQPLMKLPNERNGLLMVFRTFERISYALILENTEAVKVGDYLVSPK